MMIRSTTDPMTLTDILDPENHPCLYEGDGDNGLEISFENEENMRAYIELGSDHQIVLQGDDSDDYVAEG